MLQARRAGSRPLTVKEGRVKEAPVSKEEKAQRAADLYKELQALEVKLAEHGAAKRSPVERSPLIKREEAVLHELRNLGYSRSDAALAFDRASGSESGQADIEDEQMAA